MTEADADTLLQSVTRLAQETWAEAVAPQRQDPDSLVWRTVLSDPFPSTWPLSDDTLVFYAYARGADLRHLTSGESRGPVWARITAPCTGEAPRLVLLDTDLKPSGRQGVRPLTQAEIETLQVNPVVLLTQNRLFRKDRQLRAYYRLQRSLGNIPEQAVASHAAFFEWLG